MQMEWIVQRSPCRAKADEKPSSNFEVADLNPVLRLVRETIGQKDPLQKSTRSGKRVRCSSTWQLRMASTGGFCFDSAEAQRLYKCKESSTRTATNPPGRPTRQ